MLYEEINPAQPTELDACESRETHIKHMVSNYNNSLLRFLKRSLPSGEDPEDMVQEVYSRLVQKKNISDIKHPKGFLFRIAINLLRDKMRYRKNHHSADQVEYNDKLHVDDTPSAERVIYGKQRLTKFKAELEKLPPRPRDVFMLHRVGGMTYPQIADHLGIAQSTVEKHMIRALADLKNSMGEDQ